MQNNYAHQPADEFLLTENTINQIEYPTDCLEENFNENSFDYENAFGEFDCAGL